MKAAVIDKTAGSEIVAKVEVYSLEEANRALIELKTRGTLGAKVLRLAD